MFKKLGTFFDDISTPKKVSGKRESWVKKTQTFDFLELIYGWEKIVGEKLSKTTIPLNNQYGNLTVLTNHPAISQTLSFLEEDIKKNIFKEFPELRGKINKIFYKTNSTFFEKKMEETLKRGKKNAQFFHPYDPKNIKLRKEAEEIFSDIDDKELKEILISLFIQKAYHN